MILNFNIFLELPRQQGKTVSALCRYLWVFNFGTTNSEMAFMNQEVLDKQMLALEQALAPNGHIIVESTAMSISDKR